MINRLLLVFMLVVGGLCYGQDLPHNPMNTGQFSQLSDTEKIEYVKKWYKERINVPFVFVKEFAEAGGRDIIPWLFEELPKYEFYNDIYDERLAFIVNVLLYFRNHDLLTLYERYYVAGVLEGKIINYIKKYGHYDLLVMGINSNMWMLLNPNYVGQLSIEEMDIIIQSKYKVMGLLGGE